MIVRFVARLIAVLNSNGRPFEVGAGIACGLLLALVPGRSVLFFAILILIFFVKINLGMTIAFYLLFAVVVPAMDGALDALGYWILTRPSLEALFTRLEQVPVVPATRFTNTIVMGGFVAGVVLWFPVACLSVLLVNLYRHHVHPRIADSKLVKAYMATPFAQRIGAAIRRFKTVWPMAG